MKLHLRIFLTFTVVVTVLLTALAFLLYSYQKREIISSLTENTQVTEQFVRRALANRSDTLIASVQTIADDWALRQAIGNGDGDTIVSALNNHRHRAHAENAVFIRTDGETFGTSQSIPEDLATAWESLSTDGDYLGHQLLQIDGEYIHVVMSEVKAPQTIGWLCMTYGLTELEKTVAETSQQSGVQILAFRWDLEPTVVFASPNIEDSDAFGMISSAASRSFQGTHHTALHGREIVAHFTTLPGRPRTHLAVFEDTGKAHATLSALWQRMVLMFTLFMLVSLCITYLIARGITHPLHVLLSSIKKLEGGDFSTNIDIRRTDEIGDLALAFRKMQTALFERERKIKDSLEQLEYQASHDALTGLANRRTLAKQLEELQQSMAMTGQTFCVCIIDLDRFKVVNDTSGHAAGDALLIQIAEIIRDTVYTTDTVVRLGGDEFAVLMHDCRAKPAIRVCNRIRKQVEELVFHWDDATHRVGTSIGILSVTKPAESTSEILQRADAACFTAKELGRNQVYHVADSEPPVDEKRQELRWVQRLTMAIDKDQFLLFSQPIVPINASTEDALERREILLRLRNYETRKLVPPGAFIPSAERYGLNVKIDRWVVQQLMRLTTVYDEVFGDERMYWVNLSGASLCDDEFVDFLADKIRSGKLPVGRINFEITETAVIRNVKQAKEVMHRLKDIGCKFALDDFGAGLSSFGYLKTLPVEHLKIDGLFIRNVVENHIDRMFVKAIIDIAHAMDIMTVAEFVENQQILETITELGVTYGQGTVLGPPVELRPKVAGVHDVEDIDLNVRSPFPALT